jgi:hypothetical protein
MGGGGETPRILSLGAIYSRMVNYRSDLFIPGENSVLTHWLEGWVSPQTGLDNGSLFI